jgi:hypothetical protein
MEDTSKRWALGSGALLVMAALGVLVAQAYQYASVPSEEDWASAARYVESQAGERDAFRVEPEWDSRPRVYLQGMSYVPAEEATFFDLDPYERVWILAESRRETRAVSRMPPSWRLTSSPETFGSVTVLMASPPAENATRWDVFSALKDAKVRREYGDKTEDCLSYRPGPFQSWRCRKADPWLYVGETLQTVTNDTHRCLWAMPIDRGGRLVISFKDVPGGASLRGHYGQPIDAIRSKRGGPVRFEVLVNGEVAHRKVFGLHEEGFLPWSIPLPAGEDSLDSLDFTVFSTDKRDRFFCFTARVIK